MHADESTRLYAAAYARGQGQPGRVSRGQPVAGGQARRFALPVTGGEPIAGRESVAGRVAVIVTGANHMVEDPAVSDSVMVTVQ